MKLLYIINILSICFAHSMYSSPIGLTLKLGPIWDQDISILFPTTTQTTDIPLVSQSSRLSALNPGHAIAASLTFKPHKNLSMILGAQRGQIMNGTMLIRSFFKNPLDPQSARSIPFISSLKTTGVSGVIGGKLIMPINKEFSFEFGGGYGKARKRSTISLLENTTIFFDSSHVKTKYVTIGLSMELEKFSLAFDCQTLLQLAFLRSTQNNDPTIFLVYAPMRGFSISLSASYALTKSIKISQEIGYADSQNKHVSLSVTIIPGQASVSAYNIARIQGRGIESLTSVAFSF